MSEHRRRWLTFGIAFLCVVSAAALTVGASDAVTYDPSDDPNFVVYTYDGPESEQRQPGAEDRSYWTESVLDELPEDEDIYLLKSVTYRPVESDCGAGDIDELGIDRGGTNEGQRETDDGLTESVKSFAQEDDARDRYESEFDDPERLSTADGVTMERLEIDWYSRDDFGTPARLEHGDRFVSAQSECLDNPDTSGWYRWASYNEAELENGTRIVQEAPAYSDWYWLCECEDREEAVETLGPPPGEEPEETPTPTTDAPDETNTESSDEPASETTPTPEETRNDGETDDGTATTATPPPTPSPTPTATPEPTAQPTTTPSWDERVVRTPTEEAGSGFTAGLGVLALLITLAIVRRR